MTQTQLKNKLRKVAELAVRGATQGERDSALDKLHVLCKKYNANLSDYVSGLAPHFSEINYTEKAEPKTEAKTEDKKRSRRSWIIQFIQDNMYNTAEIATLLTNLDYPNVKANKKAVAGTIYDLQKNKSWDIRRSDNGAIRVVKK